MTSKDLNNAWVVDRLDPDNWIVIPEFGVMPIAVSGAGFAKPVVDQQENGRETRKLIREHVRLARALVQLDIQSTKQLNDLWFEELEASADALSTGLPPMLTQEQRAGSMYVWVMAELEIALRLSRHAGSKAMDRCMKSLTNAAEMIRVWSIGRASGNGESVNAYIAAKMQERSKVNASNAKNKRPNARSIDHEEVKNEFRRLVNDGFTEREARGLLVSRGNCGSQATIYRITKEVVTSGR